MKKSFSKLALKTAPFVILILISTFFYFSLNEMTEFKEFSAVDSELQINREMAAQLADQTDFSSDRNSEQNIRVNLKGIARKDEYKFTKKEKDGAYCSPNPAQNLGAVYEGSGFSLKPQTTKIKTSDNNTREIPDWNVDFRLKSINKGGESLAIAGNPRSAVEDKVLRVFHRAFIMEYENNKAGVRQNFVVKEKPAGMEKLKIVLNCQGSLKPEMTDETEIKFYGEDSKNIDKNDYLLEYSDLKVWDADGKKLDAEMDLSGSEIAMIVNDNNAKYPITVDPLSTTPSWTYESNGSYAYFGYSVASAGDVNNDGFTDVIIGAPNYSNGNNACGRAYVFEGSNSGPGSSPDWSEYGNYNNSEFGYSVSSAGDVNNDGYSDVIVGCPYYSYNHYGRAYVYYGSNSGIQSSGAWYNSPSSQNSLHFGSSVANAGDVNDDGYDDIIVGAPGYNNNYNSEGRAYVFYGNASGVQSGNYWTSNPMENNYARFGASVACAGDVNDDGFDDIIVGAPGYTNNNNSEGRAYVFYGNSSGVEPYSYWTSNPTDQSYARFGASVACAGDVNSDGYDDVIVGASGYSSNRGRAYLYYGSNNGLPWNAAWTAQGESNNHYFGGSVSKAGDINGDGYDDVIVGAYRAGNTGAIYVYYGSNNGLSGNYDIKRTGENSSNYYGYSAAAAGDVDNDANDDVIVGAYGYDNGQTNEGKSYIYNGAQKPSEVWVNPSYTSGSCGGHTWLYDAFDNFEDAYAAVAEGGTIHGEGGGASVSDITLDKDISIKGDITVDGDLTFAGGQITVDGGTLIVNGELNGFDETNPIVLVNGGKLSQETSSSIFFPISTANFYAPCIITSPTGNTFSVGVSDNTEDAVANHFPSYCYWDIDHTGGADPADIELIYDKSRAAQFPDFDENKLYVLHGDGGAWRTITPNGAATGTYSASITYWSTSVTGITDFSPFAPSMTPSIPSMTEWAAIILGGLILAFGAWFIWRKIA